MSTAPPYWGGKIDELFHKLTKNESMAYFAFLKNVHANFEVADRLKASPLMTSIATIESLVCPNCQMPAFER